MTTVTEPTSTDETTSELTDAEKAALRAELATCGIQVIALKDERTRVIARRNQIMERLYGAGDSQVALAALAKMTKGMAQQILAGPAEQRRLSRKRSARASRARAAKVAVPAKGSKKRK